MGTSINSSLRSAAIQFSITGRIYRIHSQAMRPNGAIGAGSVKIQSAVIAEVSPVCHFFWAVNRFF